MSSLKATQAMLNDMSPESREKFGSTMPTLNQNEQAFVDAKGISNRPPVTDEALGIKNRPRFTTGFNRGQGAESGMRPRDEDLKNRTVDYVFGYVFGVLERRAGNIHDNNSCTGRLNICWDLYLADQLPPMDTRLP